MAKTLIALVVAAALTATGVASAARPSITRIAPTHGIQGSRVVIYGHDLRGARVLFGSRAGLRPQVNAAGTQVTVSVPAGLEAGKLVAVKVATKGGTATASTRFKSDPIP